MRTNIERAIHGLVLSNQAIMLANALPAYLREAGFKEMSPDALIAFEHALDKYPIRTDGSCAVFVKGISGIAAEYWKSVSTALAEVPCCHCSMSACRTFSLRAEAKGRGCAHHEEKNRIAQKRRFKSKKARRIHAKRNIVTPCFDSFAPSTSAVML